MRRFHPFSFTLLLAVALLAATVQAQDAGAPAPDADNNVLYLHSDDGVDGWLNTLAADGSGATFCPGSTTATPIGALCPQQGASFTWEFPVAPSLPHDLLLDLEGTVDFQIQFGGNCCTVGETSLTVTLRSGAVDVATASGDHLMIPQPVNDNTGEPGPSKFHASVTPTVDRIPAADGIVLVVEGTGDWSHATMYTEGNTWVSLPIAGVEAGAAGEAEEEPAQNETADNATADDQPEANETDEGAGDEGDHAETDSGHEESQPVDSGVGTYQVAEDSLTFYGIHLVWYIIGGLVIVALVVPAAARK